VKEIWAVDMELLITNFEINDGKKSWAIMREIWTLETSFYRETLLSVERPLRRFRLLDFIRF